MYLCTTRRIQPPKLREDANPPIFKGLKDMSNGTRFVASFVVQRDIRFKTSRTAAAFCDTSNGGRRNEAHGKWVSVKPGTTFHLVSVTRTPDQATVIMEDGSGQGQSMILREKGWNTLKAALKFSDREKLAALEKAA